MKSGGRSPSSVEGKDACNSRSESEAQSYIRTDIARELLYQLASGAAPPEHSSTLQDIVPPRSLGALPSRTREGGYARAPMPTPLVHLRASKTARALRWFPLTVRLVAPAALRVTGSQPGCNTGLTGLTLWGRRPGVGNAPPLSTGPQTYSPAFRKGLRRARPWRVEWPIRELRDRGAGVDRGRFSHACRWSAVRRGCHGSGRSERQR